MFACSCSHPSCLVNGCMLARQYQQPHAAPHTPPQVMPPAQFAPLSEADVRRILREEIERIFKGQP